MGMPHCGHPSIHRGFEGEGWNDRSMGKVGIASLVFLGHETEMLREVHMLCRCAEGVGGS